MSQRCHQNAAAQIDPQIGDHLLREPYDEQLRAGVDDRACNDKERERADESDGHGSGGREGVVDQRQQRRAERASDEPCKGDQKHHLARGAEQKKQQFHH